MLDNRLTNRLDFDFKTSQKIIKLLTEIDRQNSRWQTQANLSPQIIDRLIQSVLITSTGASTRIEGSRMDDEQVKSLYKQLRIKKFKTRDEQEVAGYLEVLKIVFENWEELTFGEGLIKQLHTLLLKYSSKDERHKGSYKFQPNRVEARDQEGNLVQVIFNPTEPFLVPKEMQELCDWVITEFKKDELHPLLIIANFLFEYLAIHPFEDGNGRSSRLLTNFLMLKTGYEFTPYISHEKIVENNKIEYYQALNTTQQTWKAEKEDISPWVLFFLEVVKTQATNAIKLLDQDKRTEIYLSDKQRAVWEVLQNSDVLSRLEIHEITGIPSTTVRQALLKLIDMDQIETLGEGKATKYRVKNK
jgi:Fic family protein